MRHRIAGKKLGRTSSHRQAMMRNMTVSLIMHERIVTTVEKAKMMRPYVEKVITKGKSKTLHNMRQAFVSLGGDKEAVRKLFEEIGPRFENRPGGYTRILRMGKFRIGDGASRAVFELVGNKVLETKMRAQEVEEEEEELEEQEA